MNETEDLLLSLLPPEVAEAYRAETESLKVWATPQKRRVIAELAQTSVPPKDIALEILHEELTEVFAAIKAIKDSKCLEVLSHEPRTSCDNWAYFWAATFEQGYDEMMKDLKIHVQTCDAHKEDRALLETLEKDDQSDPGDSSPA